MGFRRTGQDTYPHSSVPGTSFPYVCTPWIHGTVSSCQPSAAAAPRGQTWTMTTSPRLLLTPPKPSHLPLPLHSRTSRLLFTTNCPTPTSTTSGGHDRLIPSQSPPSKDQSGHEPPTLSLTPCHSLTLPTIHWPLPRSHKAVRVQLQEEAVASFEEREERL